MVKALHAKRAWQSVSHFDLYRHEHMFVSIELPRLIVKSAVVRQVPETRQNGPVFTIGGDGQAVFDAR
jgi:hypothetical protein